MRIRWVACMAVLALLLSAGGQAAFAQGGGAGGGGGARGGGAPAAPPLRLTSSAFAEGAMLDGKYTCSAGAMAISPALSWTSVPMGTVSFTLIVHDMEPRPMRGLNDVLHWMMWNIPATATSVPENVPNTSSAVPGGAMQGNGNAQGPNFGYRPPCPPMGPPAHHYTFELFALDTKTDLPATATRDEVTKAMDGHIIGHSVLVGLYNR